MKKDLWSIVKIPYSAEPTLYQCNRDIVYNYGKKKMTELDQKNFRWKPQYSKVKYYGNELNIVEPIDKDIHIEIRLITLYRYKEL